MPHGREHRCAPEDVDEKLWNTPVPERTQLIADLAKQLFGRKRTDVSVRVDDRHLQLTIMIKQGARGKVAERNHQLFCLLAIEALDVDVLGTYQKHGDAYLKLAGTPLRAVHAQRTSTIRRYRNKALQYASYVVCFWSALECYDAYRDARTVWHDEHSFVRMAVLVCMWIGVLMGWGSYHYLVRHTVMGPMLRHVESVFSYKPRH